MVQQSDKVCLTNLPSQQTCPAGFLKPLWRDLMEKDVVDWVMCLVRKGGRWHFY